MSDEDEAQGADSGKDDSPHSGGGTADASDRDADNGSGKGSDKDGEAVPPEANPFDRAGRSPLDGAGGTGGSATARAARRALAAGRTYSIGGDGQVIEGNTFINWGGGPADFVQGAVPRETLAHLDDVYCEVAGYQRMKELLRAQRVLVLCGEPGSGRESTALALLAELTDDKVSRLDPRHAVDEITAEALEEGTGHLLRLPSDDGRGDAEPRRDRSGERREPHRTPVRLAELHLDRFAELLCRKEAYGIVVVESGDLADRLSRGRYGVTCPPPPSADVLHRHLRVLLRGEPDEALERALRLAADPEVTDALGLEELRPREAARLADHLARHQKEELGHEQLLEDCATFVRAQARAWFAGADRPGSLPEAQPALNTAAFRIAVAVFDRSAYSITAEAAELLAWEFAVTLDPGQAAGRRLFGGHTENRPALARSVLEDGEIDLGTAKVPTLAVRFQGKALATAVLGEVWHGYHNVRGPVCRWLRALCDDPRPEVWVRASIAAGVLCSWDWIHGYGELIAPMAAMDSPVARMAAATALAEAARNPRVRPAVVSVLKEWAAGDDDALLESALLTQGYVLAAGSVRGSLDALARVVRVREATDLDVLGSAAFSVIRLLASGEPGPVVRRMHDWLGDGRMTLANLVLVSTINTLTMRTTYLWGLRDVPALEPHAARPLLVALLMTRPDLAPALAELVRRALTTARSGEAALDAMAVLVRRAAKDAEALDAVCGFLPLIAVSRRDRDRLRGLLKELVRDRDRPLDKTAAGRMWDAVTEGARR